MGPLEEIDIRPVAEENEENGKHRDKSLGFKVIAADIANLDQREQSEDDEKKTDERLEILKRQVETKTNLLAQNTGANQMVSFGKLISFSSTSEKVVMYIGWILAFCTGAGMPLFA